MSEPLLEVVRVSKRFGNTIALNDAHLEVRAGEIHALCGENGAGKSTLIGIIGGAWPLGTYTGEVRFQGEPIRFRSVRDAAAAGIAVLYQEFALVPQLSIAENLFLGQEPVQRGRLLWRTMEAETERWLRRLGVHRSPRTPVGALGIGERQLVEIARALRQNARLLILDEPTAALTEAETRRLFQILRELRDHGVAMLLVTHRLGEVFQLADRVTVLRDGATVGTWEVATVAERTILEAMVGGSVESFYGQRSRLEERRGEPLLRLEGWTLRTPTGRRRVEAVSLEVWPGEVVGLAGVVGAGRSELLASLFGAWPGAVSGTMFWRGRSVRVTHPSEAVALGIALVPEDRKRMGLLLDASLLDNLSLPILPEHSPHGWIRWSRLRTTARQVVERFRIRAAGLEVPVRQLSGGNQQKVVLGKWTPRRPSLLLLDEPTRGIDVAAKAEIHTWIGRLARQERAGILMASSDLAELLALADRLLVLHEGRITARFDSVEGLSQAEVLAHATGRSPDR